MSAPQTNPEKQRRRHRGPLIGMALAVGFGVALILYWIIEEATPTDNRLENLDTPTNSDVLDAPQTTDTPATAPAATDQ